MYSVINNQSLPICKFMHCSQLYPIIYKNKGAHSVKSSIISDNVCFENV